MPPDIEVVQRNLRSLAEHLLEFPEPFSDPVPVTEVTPALIADVDAIGGALEGEGLSGYDAVGKFITALLPYGSHIVYFPNVGVPLPPERTPEKLKADRGILVAGLLRSKHKDDPVLSSSSAEMKVMDENQCFNWDFRFRDDPTLDADKTGDIQNLQVTKAMRLPFVYRREPDGKLLVAAVLIGIEGSGTG